MKWLRIAGLIAVNLLILHAEDFKLNHFAFGHVITLYTTLEYDGEGERLIATAKNESGAPILHAKICVLSAAMTKGCLFELWNTAPWAPGAELSWNTATRIKISSLAHNASLLEFDGGSAVKQTIQSAPTPPPSLIQNRPTTDQSTPETLSNETVVKLAHAGLGDDVIIGMIGTQPGRYSHGSAEIVKQKLPVELVLEEKDADYILTGLSQRTEVKWYDVVSGSIVGGKDRLEASARLVRVKDETFVWAGESGDRSLIFGALKRGGQRKLAERIVRKLKQDLF